MKEAKMRFCRKPHCIISSAYGTLCVNRRLITKRPLKKSDKIQKSHVASSKTWEIRLRQMGK